MATYAIGDVQGCYTSLHRLLDKLSFDPVNDELWLTGDLVNRGPNSAEVLRFIKSLPHSKVVLGNHDLHLLAVAEGFRLGKPTDTFQDVLSADDRESLLYWLRAQPLAHFDKNRNTLLVHAGIHPNWVLSQTLEYADEVEKLLRDDEAFPKLLARMYGDQPASLSGELDHLDRARTIINALTRIRYCSASGDMDFSQVGPPGTQPQGLYPWYQISQFDHFRVVFGHWSTLGAQTIGGVLSLDSGCVHGGSLSAIDLDKTTAQFVQVNCAAQNSSAQW